MAVIWRGPFPETIIQAVGFPEMLFNPERLQQSLSGVGITSGDDLFPKLLRAYSAPGRHYHGTHHVGECLRHFETYRDVADEPGEVEVSIWFHDAVYETDRNDNEEKSAQWAESYLKQHRIQADTVARVVDMILATKTHVARTNDEKLMLDIDLGILGSTPETFERYDSDIRKEFEWVPFDTYCTGRSNVLQGFLEREFIYQTAGFRRLFEEQARANLKKKIGELDSRVGS